MGRLSDGMRWLRPKALVETPITAFVPEGEVVYAIGDIHGRADLLDELLYLIQIDMGSASGRLTRIITLGDYVDRGPESRRVIDMLIALKQRFGDRVTVLRGNHEAALLDFLHEPRLGVGWCDFGGRDTLASYGVQAPRGRNLEAWKAAQQTFHDVLPEEHLRFLVDLETCAVFGDYVFVHAGLRPRVPLEQQSEEDMLWIREEFLRAPPWSSQVVVHGHTPCPEPIEGPARIGVDTGAYATGVLTAVRLEADQRRYIQTGG